MNVGNFLSQTEDFGIRKQALDKLFDLQLVLSQEKKPVYLKRMLSNIYANFEGRGL